MNENIKTKKLEQLRCSLQEKEKIVLNSQIKQRKLESQIQVFNTKKQNIIKNKTNILSKFMSFVIYDIIMLTILYLFVSNIIGKVTSILAIYCGVISISIIGAFISSKLENIIKKHYKKKKLQIILKKTKEKEQEIKLEKERRETIEQEISEIISNLYNITSEICPSEYCYENSVYYEKNTALPKVRSKIKCNKKR